MIPNYNVQKEFLKNINAAFPLFTLSCFQRFSSIDEQCYICGEVLYLHLRNVKA